MNIGDLLNLQILMFLEMIVGYLICKFKIVKSEVRVAFSDLVINVILPCSIIYSFNMELDKDTIGNFILLFITSACVTIVLWLICKICYNKVASNKKAPLQYATVFSNSSFLGCPVVSGVYGNLGLIYTQIYGIPISVGMWSLGISYFQQGKGNIKEIIIKILKHPCVVAVELGLLRMIFNIQLPTALDNTLSSLGSCLTPCVMLYLGMTMYEVGFKGLFSPLNFLYSLIRLIIIPAILLLICYLFHIDSLLSGVIVLLNAMPAPTTTAIMSQQYGGDQKFSANIVVLSTLLSIIVLPVWIIIIECLF